jgi:Prokaryotic homologs of the JAB domain
VKEVAVHSGGTVITTFEEFADGRCEARLHYAQAGGGWEPPLPLDVRAPDGLGRSTSWHSVGSVSRGTTKARDLAAFGHPSSKVEIHRHSTEYRPFTVTLGSGARRAIEEEIALVRRELGSDYECGGWLYGQNRPRANSDGLTIAVATHAGDSGHRRNSVHFGESATSLMLRSFPPELDHMTPVGDWHSHPTRGSTIPSEADARGWARSLDEYGFSRYTAVIVSPSESMGWMSPVFSAWTTRREGHPSLPVCEPARLA